MIVVKRKELEWIIDTLTGAKKVVVLGCGACVTVCHAGGEKEVEELCCALQLAMQERDEDIQFEGLTCTRVCEWEFVEPVADMLRSADAVLSLACGVGINLLAERLPDTPVLPGVDTLFMGTCIAPNMWQELCAGCGQCVLDRTFGFCPIARCAKTLLNGPCGGSNDGKCEVSQDIDCVWAKIIERAQALGRMDEFEEIMPPKDWSTARDGGQRTLDRSDLAAQRLLEEELDEI